MMTRAATTSPRRPIALRTHAVSIALARRLTALGVSPNAISLTGLGCAVAAGFTLGSTAFADGTMRVAFLVATVLLVQMRLLCNMLDGMVAIEGGKRTAYGEIFNDMPDRFADVAILAGAGYAIRAMPGGPELGWIAATFAVLTAYVRLLGASMGTAQHFIGPMAKPHRMGAISIACIASAFEPAFHLRGETIEVTLAVVIAGCVVTFVRRTIRIVADVGARA